MEYKKLMSAALMLGALSFGATTASAKTAYLGTLNGSLGTSFVNPTHCTVCHSAAGNAGGDKGVTAIAPSLGIVSATRDSDGDGFTDIQEVSGLLMNFNSAAITPFTVAAATATAADSVLTNYLVLGDSTATEQAFADPYSLAGAGQEIVGGVSLTVNAAPATIFMKSVGANTAMSFYGVDATGAGTLAVAGTDYTINANGSVTIPVTAVTPLTVVSVRTLPVAGSSGGGGGGCITASVSTPLMMLFALLTLGFFVRRKKD